MSEFFCDRIALNLQIIRQNPFKNLIGINFINQELKEMYKGTEDKIQSIVNNLNYHKLANFKCDFPSEFLRFYNENANKFTSKNLEDKNKISWYKTLQIFKNQTADFVRSLTEKEELQAVIEEINRLENGNSFVSNIVYQLNIVVNILYNEFIKEIETFISHVLSERYLNEYKTIWIKTYREFGRNSDFTDSISTVYTNHLKQISSELNNKIKFAWHTKVIVPIVIFLQNTAVTQISNEQQHPDIIFDNIIFVAIVFIITYFMSNCNTLTNYKELASFMYSSIDDLDTKLKKIQFSSFMKFIKSLNLLEFEKKNGEPHIKLKAQFYL